MRRDASRIALLHRKLGADDDATHKRNVPMASAVGLVALLVLALPRKLVLSRGGMRCAEERSAG